MQILIMGIMLSVLIGLCNGYSGGSVLLQCILCFVFYFAMIFFFFNAYVPLLWLPYVLFKILTGRYKYSAIILCIFAPFVWNFILGIVITVLFCFEFARNILYAISPAIIVAAAGAGITTIINILSSSAISEFKEQLIKCEK